MFIDDEWRSPLASWPSWAKHQIKKELQGHFIPRIVGADTIRAKIKKRNQILQTEDGKGKGNQIYLTEFLDLARVPKTFTHEMSSKKLKGPHSSSASTSSEDNVSKSDYSFDDEDRVAVSTTSTHSQPERSHTPSSSCCLEIRFEPELFFGSEEAVRRPRNPTSQPHERKANSSPTKGVKINFSQTKFEKLCKALPLQERVVGTAKKNPESNAVNRVKKMAKKMRAFMSGKSTTWKGVEQDPRDENKACKYPPYKSSRKVRIRDPSAWMRKRANTLICKITSIINY